ncbi:MAG TPA: beta-ketoacyl synthase N-terminal-like domain-containing protein [Oligoflexus sp.]|uniref:beta-ketoacyl synthase N-terminal-like domain-containing protein n=1 Tax=Oligoflexus sp. TaxID=1971216 RepID=UPI002D802951|nr:beta-ketoacyl synthase N-terminal-like domain-containing protein [Oligoflexus sp.]HET9240819.1 beta-ketoacyl synthase N-terminal-like domain-containing protein [Oligoflexus sp.]
MSIAIVSMGLRLPGARTAQEFWQHIVDSRDLGRPVAEGRWPLPAAYFQQHPEDRITHDRVYALEQQTESSVGLEIDAEVMQALDPLFHLALGAGRDAFFGSRHQNLDRQRCAVILGNIALPTASSAAMAADWLRGKMRTSDAKAASQSWNLSPAALPASVLARALGLGGESFTLDAACASSLYAIKLACDALESRQMDCVLAGGLSRPDSLYTQVGFTALQALSRKGLCHAFDEKADGLMVGEGAGIFVLKRLDDAIQHGDHIWAVIRGAGLSNDREGRLMAPSTEGQLRAMQAAYAEAGWQPQDVQMIECHATGTPLGDKTEWETLLQLWSDAPLNAHCVLGSVKPNVGHMLTAAGAAGLAKILMAMQEGVLPPTANFEKLPASWNKERPHFRVLQNPEQWQADNGLRRAAISGFGFGGINAHLLLEKAVDGHSYATQPAATPGLRKVAIIAAAQLDASDFTFEHFPEEADAVAADAFARAAIPYGLFRIPPTELNEILPQQLYSLLALRKLDLPEWDDAILQKMACVVGLELDPVTNLYACRWALQADGDAAAANALIPPLNADRVIGALGSIVASRIAREARLGGPSFTVSAMENSGLKALDLAQSAVARGETPAALVFAVDMPGSARGRAQLALRQKLGEIQMDVAVDSVAAMVLADAEWAASQGLPVLAEIESVHLHARQPGASSQAPRVANYRGSATALLDVIEELQNPAWRSEASQEWRIVGSDQQLGTLRLLRKGAPLRMKQLPQKPGLVIERRDLEVRLGETGYQPPLPPPDTDVAEFQPHALTDSNAADYQPSHAPAPSALWQQLLDHQKQVAASHESFLRYRVEGDALLQNLLQKTTIPSFAQAEAPDTPRWVHEPFNTAPALFDYAACKEFAAGRIAPVFGPDFAEVDSYPTRVRLPDERLLLCHRVMSIEGEPRSLGEGFMITEHDVFADAWYLDDGRMPTSIAVESGQADLMLSAWLGADFKTKGQAVYRLLDAKVCFHNRLPAIGSTVRYHIRIKRFFEQGGTLFFHFNFEATVDGEPLMTMTDGCAGFFTEEALAEGRGVKRSQLQLTPAAGRWTGGYKPLVPVADASYDDAQLDALRSGDYAACFGQDFARLQLDAPKRLPGGDMRLVHRIPELQVHGGRYGKGRIIGEADIHPDDWFLTCHFVDDEVMPGTLMYECCLHTLRIYLMRMGWVGPRDSFSFEPIPGIVSQLKCRGQVLASTRKVTYEVEIKEMGYGPEPYVIGDALMYADDKPIVDITNICLKVPGQSRESLEALWQQHAPAPAYTYENILAFSSGKPSDCFGPAYEIFDEQRRIARLPRPPFQFLDRVEWVEGPLMQQHVGTELVAAYDPPADAWYWEAEGNGTMPFAVLLEIALQPCGFMAAYMGSALLSEQDLSFRNLSGDAKLYQSVRRGSGTLHIHVKSTKIARSGSMIIQDYTFAVSNAEGPVYEGSTSFGYFTTEALAQQIGLRHVAPWKEVNPARTVYPEGEGWPRSPILMVDAIEVKDAQRVFGKKTVRTDEWFFDAHFYQDPVMPGSLGLEALLQTLKAAAHERWPEVESWRISPDSRHSWTYRGQVPPRSATITLALDIRNADDARHQLTADGLLYRDELPIYSIQGLKVEPV